MLNTNGVVVVAPTTTGGSCPSAWFSCAADQGGDCCPQGFACGQQSCTATASGQSGVEDKVQPSSQASYLSVVGVYGMAGLAGLVGVAMVVL